MKLHTAIVRKLRRIKRNIRIIWHPTERQLWAAYRLGHAAKTNEEKRKPRFMPMLCNTCKHSYAPKEPPEKKVAYEPPSPTTDGKIRAERMDNPPALIPHPQGRYFQKRRKEFITTKLMPIAERPESFLL